MATSFISSLGSPLSAFFRARTGRVQGSGWTELSARRIFILPTRAGLGYGLLLLVLLIGAINYNNNLVFGLTFLLAGLGLVAMLHTYRNLAHLQLQAGQGRPGFVGEQVGFQVWLRSADGRPRFAVELRTSEGMTASTHVHPSQGGSVWLTRPAARRGPVALGLVRVSGCFPLGIFYAWSRIEFDHSELAYPAPAAPGARPQANALLQAGTIGSDRGDGREDFRGFRPYHPGDSLRHVDWKAVARGQGMLTKEFGSTQAKDLWLDYQHTPDIEPEARLRRLCRWILEAERAQHRYGLRLPKLAIEPGRGAAHRDRCLAALAQFEVRA